MITQFRATVTDEAGTLKLIELEPPAGAKVLPVQPVVLATTGLATTKPLGKVSLKFTPVRVVLPDGLAIVMVKVEFALGATIVGEKVFVTVGAAFTVKFADAVNPVPPLVELTVPVVFVTAPIVLSVTLTEIVQFVPGVDVAPPLRFSTVSVGFGVNVPPQLFVTLGTDATLMPAGSASEIATPVSVTPAAFAAGLVMVMVRVEVPLTPMLVGLKAFVTVGGATTVRTAFAVLPVPPLVELTAPVVLDFEPALVAETLTTRVQLPLVASEPPLRLMLPAPCVAVNVPPQPLLLDAGGVATTSPDGNVSVTARPVCV